MSCLPFSLFFLFLFFVFTSGYEYVVKTFSVPVDHFSFSSNETFKIRYLINDTYWNEKSGPIFFYTGNEGNIEVFANNTGFMWDIAPKFGALVVFAEHRFYGESQPFGNSSFSPKHLGYLTSQQALADYVDLIWHLNGGQDPRAYRNPVIAFGGSYGGMLAAYIRMKYPHVVAGSLAASAPIWQFTGMTPCDAFSRIVTADFKAENESCSTSIKNSWSAINNITSTEDGLKWLTANWSLCSPLKNVQDVETLKKWLEELYSNLAMINYPYENDFLMKVPGYPIREVCKHLQNSSAADKDLLRMLFQGITVYFNYTGSAKCLNYTGDLNPSLKAVLWGYQACTEMVMPMCQTGKHDMFEPREWNLTEFSVECQKTWKASPKPFLAEKMYGGKHIETASNIIFSNGLLDPWASGGVLKPPSPAVTVNIIPEGAHHLDLRGNHPADPASVRQSRLLYQKIFKKWIKDYKAKYFY